MTSPWLGPDLIMDISGHIFNSTLQTLPWEESSTERGLKENLGVETSRSRVKWSSWDSWVDEIRGRDRVAYERFVVSRHEIEAIQL